MGEKKTVEMEVTIDKKKIEEFSEECAERAVIAIHDFIGIIDKHELDRDYQMFNIMKNLFSIVMEGSFALYDRNDVQFIGYDRLLELARAMHLWIFDNVGDEYEVYKELGMTDKENAILGYGGQFIIRAKEEENGEEHSQN